MAAITAYVATIVTYILRFLQIMLFVRAILSWFPIDRGNKLSELIEFFTEPLLMPVRRFLHRVQVLRQLPIDFSTIIVYFILEILITFL